LTKGSAGKERIDGGISQQHLSGGDASESKNSYILKERGGVRSLKDGERRLSKKKTKRNDPDTTCTKALGEKHLDITLTRKERPMGLGVGEIRRESEVSHGRGMEKTGRVLRSRGGL